MERKCNGSFIPISIGILLICLIICLPQIIPKSIAVAAADVTPGRMVFHGNENKKMVALTFDDGPDNVYTVRMLDILKRNRVKATFFVVGRLVKRNPQVLKRIVREGHVLGNHSWDHRDFTKLSSRQIKRQLERTNQAVRQFTGKELQLFRPPFGAINRKIGQQLTEQRFTIIYWNLDTKDWSGRTSKRIMSVIKRNLQPGSIILLHSAGGNKHLQGTIRALPRIIHYLREKGYAIVTIDRLLDMPAYHPFDSRTILRNDVHH